MKKNIYKTINVYKIIISPDLLRKLDLYFIFRFFVILYVDF